MQFFIDPDGVDDVLAKSEREFGELLVILEKCDQLTANLVAEVEAGAPGIADRLRYLATTEQESRAKGFSKAFDAREALAACVADYGEYDASAADQLNDLCSVI